MKIDFIRVISFLLLTTLLANCSDNANNSTQSIPVLTTDMISNISSNSCVTGGKITSNGNSEITIKGIVWGINSNPTLTDFFTQDGVGNTNFTSSITNLQQNTTYYVRAYAINNIGISYGQEESFTTLQAFEPSCLPSNLQNGILAFFPFTKGSINDFSGNKYHLTNTTTASSSQDRNGNPGCAFAFSNISGDFLHYTNPTFLNNFSYQSFSISLWCKTIGTRYGGAYEVLISRGVTNAYEPITCENGQWALGLHDCKRPVFSVGGNSVWGNTPIGETDCSLVSNSWTHIVISFDGSTRKIYLNGILNKTETGSCGITNNNTGDLYLGKNYTGTLDDVIIYNRILTQTEITELYNLQSCSQ